MGRVCSGSERCGCQGAGLWGLQATFIVLEMSQELKHVRVLRFRRTFTLICLEEPSSEAALQLHMVLDMARRSSGWMWEVGGRRVMSGLGAADKVAGGIITSR